MADIEKYSFSFTAASLRLNDFRKVVEHLEQGTEFNMTQEIGQGKSNTGKRIFAELKKRYEALTPKQRQTFLEGDLSVQIHIAFLSVCKCYALVREFVLEVLREKTLVFDEQLSEGEFLSFIRYKSELHDELNKITDKTHYKIKQVTFKLLEDAGIIDSVASKMIQPQILDSQTISAITEENPNWLKIYCLSDFDIQNLTA